MVICSFRFHIAFKPTQPSDSFFQKVLRSQAYSQGVGFIELEPSVIISEMTRL